MAIAWGPLAGYYAHQYTPPLRVVPLPASDGPAGLQFAFDMAIATRTGDQALLRELDAIVTRKRPEIGRLRARYRVVRL